MNQAAAYQLGQVRAQVQQHSTYASRNTTSPAPMDLREVGGSHTPAIESSATACKGYTSPPPMREIGNAGLVRPTDGLNFEPDFVDCPNCRTRRKTVVKRVPSETTRYVFHDTYSWRLVFRGLCGCFANAGLILSMTRRQLKFSYAMGSFPLLGICGLIPDCMEMAYNTEHRCSGCDWKLAVIQHDQRPGNAPYVQSHYSMEA